MSFCLFLFTIWIGKLFKCTLYIYWHSYDYFFAGRPRHSGSSRGCWQKGRKCEWKLLVCLLPCVWRLCQLTNGIHEHICLRFSGSARYWWKRWHTWNTWNQSKLVLAAWNKKKNCQLKFFFFLLSHFAISLFYAGCSWAARDARSSWISRNCCEWSILIGGVGAWVIVEIFVQSDL